MATTPRYANPQPATRPTSPQYNAANRGGVPTAGQVQARPQPGNFQNQAARPSTFPGYSAGTGDHPSAASNRQGRLNQFLGQGAQTSANRIHSPVASTLPTKGPTRAMELATVETSKRNIRDAQRPAPVATRQRE